MVPIAQLLAVGGRSTSDQGACEFQLTKLAPAQPCPVPKVPRLMNSSPALPVTFMLSNSTPDAHFWCGPMDWCESIALPKTNTLGPTVPESCVTKGAWAPYVVFMVNRSFWTVMFSVALLMISPL